jgi:hypothetical protein
MKEITLCLTSCNRFNLLQATIDSFLSLNTYPIKRYLLHEDSNNIEMFNKVKEKYPMFECIRSEKNVGLLKSIDTLYSMVDTEFIFHLEDDWIFENNPNFIQESLEVLKDTNIHQVWIRQGIPEDWLEKQDLGGYRMVKQSHFGDWCGFSFNPSLKRLSDYKKMFPNGFDYYNTHGTNSALNEHECNQVASALGYRAAILNNRVCRHLGEGKSTYK